MPLRGGSDSNLPQSVPHTNSTWILINGAHNLLSRVWPVFSSLFLLTATSEEGIAPGDGREEKHGSDCPELSGAGPRRAFRGLRRAVPLRGTDSGGG